MSAAVGSAFIGVVFLTVVSSFTLPLPSSVMEGGASPRALTGASRLLSHGVATSTATAAGRGTRRRRGSAPLYMGLKRQQQLEAMLKELESERRKEELRDMAKAEEERRRAAGIESGIEGSNEVLPNKAWRTGAAAPAGSAPAPTPAPSPPEVREVDLAKLRGFGGQEAKFARGADDEFDYGDMYADFDEMMDDYGTVGESSASITARRRSEFDEARKRGISEYDDEDEDEFGSGDVPSKPLTTKSTEWKLLVQESERLLKEDYKVEAAKLKKQQQSTPSSPFTAARETERRTDSGESQGQGTLDTAAPAAFTAPQARRPAADTIAQTEFAPLDAWRLLKDKDGNVSNFSAFVTGGKVAIVIADPRKDSADLRAALSGLAKNFPRQLADVIAVTADTPAQNRKLAKKLKLKFPVLSDPELLWMQAYQTPVLGGGEKVVYIIDSQIAKFLQILRKPSSTALTDTLKDALKKQDKNKKKNKKRS